jgi:hypothetical protein
MTKTLDLSYSSKLYEELLIITRKNHTSIVATVDEDTEEQIIHLTHDQIKRIYRELQSFSSPEELAALYGTNQS